MKIQTLDGHGFIEYFHWLHPSPLVSTNGEDLHNPHSLTSEQVGKGYRLLLSSEARRLVRGKSLQTRRPTVGQIHKWSPISGSWKEYMQGSTMRIAYLGTNPKLTYRTKIVEWDSATMTEQASVLVQNTKTELVLPGEEI